jgi:hypothetical protein
MCFFAIDHFPKPPPGGKHRLEESARFSYCTENVMELHGKGIEMEKNLHYTHSKPGLGSGGGEFITYTPQIICALIQTLYRSETLLK